ncbi:MAG: cell division protein FtsQ/DivIB [Lachnospiraceae bacterium]
MLVKLKRKRTIPAALGILLLVIMILAILYGGSTIKTVKVTGNSYYTEDEIREILFGTAMDNNTISTYLINRFGEHKTIPFVERYQIEIVNRHEVEVILYEKNIIGYVHFMGSNMYFDRDGTIVESSREVLDGICEIKGITFSKIVFNEKLETDIPGLFEQILLMTQLFEKYELDIDALYFDEAKHIKIFYGDITVELGAADNMDIKISEMNDILPELEGKKGTLYLDTLEMGASSSGTYYFKTDTAPEATE